MKNVGFSKPKEFYANISNKLSEVLVKEFGVDDSSTYVQIVTDKGHLSLNAGDVVWKKSEIVYDEDGLVDSTTADYEVKGVADEGLTVDLFFAPESCEVICQKPFQYHCQKNHSGMHQKRF